MDGVLVGVRTPGLKFLEGRRVEIIGDFSVRNNYRVVRIGEIISRNRLSEDRKEEARNRVVTCTKIVDVTEDDYDCEE